MSHMTSTRNPNKTWTRNLEVSTVSYLRDDAFGTYRDGRSYYYNVRGKNGRFVKVAHRDQCRIDGQFFVDERGDAHSTTNCPEVVGAAHHDPTGDGWLCSTCIHVPVGARIAAESVPQNHGTQVCGECCTEKHIKKFPTVHVFGVVTRGGTCRQCQAEGREARRSARRGPWA